MRLIESVCGRTQGNITLLSSSNFTRSKLLTADLQADLIDLLWGI